MPNQRMPWDETSQRTEASQKKDSSPSSTYTQEHDEVSTTDGTPKYELGKPVRITIKGDLKK